MVPFLTITKEMQKMTMNLLGHRFFFCTRQKKPRDDNEPFDSSSSSKLNKRNQKMMVNLIAHCCLLHLGKKQEITTSLPTQRHLLHLKKKPRKAHHRPLKF
jgi:hypothetical protein